MLQLILSSLLAPHAVAIQSGSFSNTTPLQPAVLPVKLVSQENEHGAKSTDLNINNDLIHVFY